MRPIETNLSLYNLDHKANEMKDPNSLQQAAFRQDQIKKNLEHQAKSVQALEKTDADVKIKVKEKNEEEEKKKKKQNLSAASKDEGLEKDSQDDIRSVNNNGSFNFIA